MQLKQLCPHCERKYENIVSKLKADPNLQGQFLDVSIDSIPKPKPVTVEKESLLGSKILVKLSCGHSITQGDRQAHEIQNLASLNQKKHAYDYQQEGVKFIQDSGYNCLIADEQGLGKTVQAILAIREACDKFKRVVIIVKQTTMYQWIREIKEWGSLDDLGVCPILTSNGPIIPIFHTYIVSMDLLPDVKDKLIALKPDLVIADEVQCFKNVGSKRSKALVKLIQDGKVEHKIFLSGTPIKNRASEYFVVLNLLAPGYFPSYRQFCIRWLELNEKNVYQRLRKYVVDDFRKLTARWILRREVADVMKDLPPVRYVTQEIEITDPIVKKSYNQEIDLFSNFLNDAGTKKDPVSLLGWLARFRKLTAMAKMSECGEIVKDFLDSTEDQKIAIGIHHKVVRDNLFYSLEPYGCVKLSGEDSAQVKDWNVKKFQENDHRALVINSVSGGTGLDGLQVCNNVLVLERQWSFADEDQFVKRFARNGQTKPVLVTYLDAKGTIDAFMREMYETKKEISEETYGNQWDMSSDTESLKDLAQRVIENRL